MASNRHVRVFPAEHIILDEASQMKEYETVNPTARFHVAHGTTGSTCSIPLPRI